MIEACTDQNRAIVESIHNTKSTNNLCGTRQHYSLMKHYVLKSQAWKTLTFSSLSSEKVSMMIPKITPRPTVVTMAKKETSKMVRGM